MKTSRTLQLHMDGAWRDPPALSLTGPVEQDIAAPFLDPLTTTLAQVRTQLEPL